jgi:hypothetical protein
MNVDFAALTQATVRERPAVEMTVQRYPGARLMPPALFRRYATVTRRTGFVYRPF